MDELEKIIQNTETACALCERDFSHAELIGIIKSDNDLEKQICILKLTSVKNQQEANLLVFNLTNHHGIIREAIGIKINELMQDENYSGFFQTESITDTFLDAIIDMNPNICRLIIEILPYITDKKPFFEKLYKRAIEVIEDASTMNRRNKGYIYSKKVFKIFWYLEAVSSLKFFEQKAEIQTLLQKTYKFEDYTIREKASKIVSFFDDINDEILQSLRNDENYFVRRLLC